jgi:hypothetical protein
VTADANGRVPALLLAGDAGRVAGRVFGRWLDLEGGEVKAS